MRSTRDQIIETTSQLIELQGYHATGLNQIVAESGAPKGSLYHYFPDGKDEMVEEAIARSRDAIARRLQEGMNAYPSAKEAVPAFLRTLAHYVHASGYQAGGPITAVAVEVASTNQRLNAACRQAYRRWQGIIEQKLLADGCDAVRAKRLGRFTIAMFEGAILLSRSEQNVTPLLDAATELAVLLDT